MYRYMRYAVDLRHPLEGPLAVAYGFEWVDTKRHITSRLLFRTAMLDKLICRHQVAILRSSCSYLL